MTNTTIKTNNLNELMAVTAEECAELTQVCMKILRFGIDKDEYKDKQQMLIEEVGDVACMIDLLVEHGCITQAQINTRKDIKRNKLKVYSSLISE